VRTELQLTPKPPFDFERTVRSHGWVSLVPNSWNAERQALERAERLRSGRVVLLTVSSSGTRQDPLVEIEVDHCGDLLREERKEISASVAWMVRADEDLSAFYAECEARGGPWLAVASGQGRLLRSPRLFEDVVRTILTTNIQWGGTVRMVSSLVQRMGEPFPGDGSLRAFPTAAAIAAMPLDDFCAAARLGYRGRYVHELAARVVTGALDLEALRDSAVPTADLRKRLLAIKGVGRYAAATLLMVLGRYEDLAVDTEFRQFVTQKYFAGQPVSDKLMMAVYDDWGRWKYLAYWFDLLSD
jgi:3-methyladenine DNA glycosylase/8-oxoguanine DNA glycosylase